ncbi:dephospho-CoA kinase [Sphaerisporangium rubeum]|uniref:Dephospho-CoA kinase n=1 Tax=Sphaerisporangium rubeum TaxID=321317 RepID=A0A7X0IGB6_9ACTN|nr:dephospho-CoA kinase [Sphaerisporangium rubeum]MBB6474443.1 dephospho-CoA kinase [Sphaerisporangium rubeum]
MLKVGLTGGIGSGKSEVAKRLGALGAVVIDADKIAREVVEPGTSGLALIVEEFGPEILRADGALDRERLGRIVFADPERLARLNAIVHPRVGDRVAELQAEAPEDAVVVYDVPLLAENGLASMYDVVIVVDAPDDVRVSRVVHHRGMSEDDALARIKAQATRDDRLKVADIVVPNDGPLADLDARTREVWQELLTRTDSR